MLIYWMKTYNKEKYRSSIRPMEVGLEVNVEKTEF
jgi:hypothetical protein